MSSDFALELPPPRFESLGAMMIAGIVERHRCEASTGIPNQWQRFARHLGTFTDQVGPYAYGVCSDFDKEGTFEYACGVQVQGAATVPRGVTITTVPVADYVVFTHRGHISGIRDTIAAIWNRWLPKSGREASGGPMLERYGPEFNPQTGLGDVEVWIPIKK